MAEVFHPGTSPKQDYLRQICKEKKFVLAAGPRFSTKCVSPETLVWTEHGPIPIGSLGNARTDLFSPIDIQVVSMDGNGFRLAKSDQFYNSGTRKAFCLRTAFGYELTCSVGHPIWSECEGQIGYRTSREICELVSSGKSVWIPMVLDSGHFARDYVTERIRYFPGRSGQQFEASERIQKAVRAGCKTTAQIVRAAKTASTTARKFMDKPMVPHSFSIKFDEEVAYMMGLMVGDGCYTPPLLASYRVCFSNTDAEILTSIKKVIEERFPDSKFIHDFRCDYSIQSAAFRAFLKCTGMAGKYAHEKVVPPVIFRSPKPVIRAFLQGLFDTDGMACGQGQASYCTASPQLSREVQSMLLCFGVRSSRIFTPNDCRGAWIIRARIEDQFHLKIGFRVSRKQAKMGKAKAFKQTRSAYPDSFVEALKDLHRTRKARGVGELSRRIHNRTIGAVFRRNTALSKPRVKAVLDVLKCEDSETVTPYWMGGSIWWDKIQSITPTESPLVDISVPETHNFVGNGFINHNTLGCLSAFAEHSWLTPRGNNCMITISQTVGIDSGIWKDFTEVIIPKWIGGNFGMQWVRRPFIMGSTKKPTCEITNVKILDYDVSGLDPKDYEKNADELRELGATTIIQLESLKVEEEAEDRFKPRRYSCIYVPELSSFRYRKTFDTWTECLRLIGLPSDKHLFLADTNPADEGVDSWIYQVWFELMDMETDDVDPQELALRDNLARVDFDISDNIFDTPGRIAELKAKYYHDKDLYDRYINGKWVTASEDAIFHTVYRPHVHEVGEQETPANKEPETMVPEENCFELKGGWDLGVTNSAFCIAERVYRIEKKVVGVDIEPVNGEPPGRVVEKRVPVFKFIDELVVTGESFSMEDFVLEALKKIQYWERFIGRPISWRHWSDRSAFDMHNPVTTRYHHQIVFDASSGKITLEAVQRGPGSVAQRVDLWKKCLFDDRLFFSRTNCPRTIQMNKSIKRGKSSVAVISKGSVHKHPFDAASYILSAEIPEELQREVIKNLLAQRRKPESQVAVVSL